MLLKQIDISPSAVIAEDRPSVYRQIQSESCCLIDLYTQALSGKRIITKDAKTVGITLDPSGTNARDIEAIHNFEWAFDVDVYLSLKSGADRVRLIYEAVHDALIFLAQQRCWDTEQLEDASKAVAATGFIYRDRFKEKKWDKDKSFGVSAGVELTFDSLTLEAYLFKRGNKSEIALRQVCTIAPNYNSLHYMVGSITWKANRRVEIKMPSWSFARKQWIVDFSVDCAQS